MTIKTMFICGSEGIWGHALQELFSYLPLRIEFCNSLTTDSLKLYHGSVCGVVYVYADRGPCPLLMENLHAVSRLDSIPQIVICEQLGSLFSMFKNVKIIPLSAQLNDIINITLNHFTKKHTFASVKHQFSLPDLWLQFLNWQRNGICVKEIASKWDVPIRTVYARISRYKNKVSILETTECAAVSGMISTLQTLQRSWI